MKVFRIRIKDVQEQKELRFALTTTGQKWTVDDLFKILQGAVKVGKTKEKE